jgi:MerR family transcriptional regulator, light-induced transcriptional regulator
LFKVCSNLSQVYSVSHAASLAGVAAPTLRAWERRYGVVTPKRTAGGYRVYDDADVRLLRAMKVLVLAGWSTRAAAERVRVAGDLPLTEEAAREVTGVGGAQTEANGTVGVLAELALQLDPKAIDEALDREFSRAPFEVVADDWLLPALVELGTAWQSGRVNIGGEHVVTAAVLRRVAAIFDGSPAATEGPLILAGLPGGSRHEIGVLAFATLLRRAGANVRYLGGDLPTTSWVESAGQTRPAAIVLGVATMSDVIAARDAINALRATCPGVEVYLGGGAQASVHVAAHPLGHNLLAAADALMMDLGLLGGIPGRVPGSGPVRG